MRRIQARRGNGRFTRNTPENTLGLHMGIHERKPDGSWCGAFNPSPVGAPRPTHCHACGCSLVDAVRTVEDEQGERYPMEGE